MKHMGLEILGYNGLLHPLPGLMANALKAALHISEQSGELYALALNDGLGIWRN